MIFPTSNETKPMESSSSFSGEIPRPMAKPMPGEFEEKLA